MASPELSEVSTENTEDSPLPKGETISSASAQIFPAEQQVTLAEKQITLDENEVSQIEERITQSEVQVSEAALQVSLVETQLSQTGVQISPAEVQVSPVEYALSPKEEARSPAELYESPTEMYLSPTDMTNEEPGDGKKTKRRGSAWTDDQTDFLMEVWARHTDSTGNEEYAITNAPIYRIISKSMGELGYLDKTSDQCKCRIHTLKRAYKLTKAEIDCGALNITFCRHYEKLKIIMGDDPTTTPKQLSEILAERRRTKKLTGGHEAKPKKLKPNSEHKVKRALALDGASPDITLHGSLPKQPYKDNAQLPQVPQLPPLPAVSSLWNHQSYTFPFAVPPLAQNLTYPDSHYSAPLNNQNTSYQNSVEQPASPNDAYDINHNTTIIVKQEKIEPDGYPVYQPYISKATDAVSQTKEEIERMRLDLEMKKIEMERNRLEMEERQRREDRDHQYRMMQLLLMGLGHNPGLGVAGQGTESEEANQPELSRALEGGLVPGGAQSANEKGLSFSEI